MKALSIPACLLLSLCPMQAWGVAPVPPPQGADQSAQSEMPHGIESTLQKYISAYERRNMQDLLAVWPDLQADKKEFKTIKRHFDDGNVSNEHMSLHPLQTQTLKDDAIVQCERTEQFDKNYTLESGGDLDRNRSPAQNSGPREATKPVKNVAKIWMKLHRQGDDWLIVAVSTKPLTF